MHMLKMYSFNRYIVECKYTNVALAAGTGVGFNRYIVECKYISFSGGEAQSKGFNRYIVECKQVLYLTARLMNLVLIDTQWNVNAYINQEA